LIFALIPHAAHAALDCTVKSAQLVQGHANTYLVPTGNIAIGDFVGTINHFDIIYRCKVSGTPTRWTMAERNVTSVTDTGFTKNWNATSNYRILTTPQLQQRGLGFSGFYFHRNEWPPGRALEVTDTWGGVTWKNLPPADGDGYVELGITLYYRFSKINNNLDTTGSPVVVQTLPFNLAAFLIHDDEATGSGDWSPVGYVTATMPTLTIAQRACTPFTNTVKLPAINESDLNQINIGDSLPPTDFWIQMRCPSNIGYIGYYVTPSAHGFENEAQGVIKINPDTSTAKGIGLQITTRSIPQPTWLAANLSTDYQPLKFGANNLYYVHSSLGWGAGPDTDPLSHETDHTAPHGTIPLRVAVYRTGTVVPGTYNAAIFIHLVYQ